MRGFCKGRHCRPGAPGCSGAAAASPSSWSRCLRRGAGDKGQQQGAGQPRATGAGPGRPVEGGAGAWLPTIPLWGSGKGRQMLHCGPGRRRVCLHGRTQPPLHLLPQSTGGRRAHVGGSGRHRAHGSHAVLQPPVRRPSRPDGRLPQAGRGGHPARRGQRARRTLNEHFSDRVRGDEVYCPDATACGGCDTAGLLQFTTDDPTVSFYKSFLKLIYRRRKTH